ncbi:MAG TPA: TonB-dependent receptor, partial [Candidatus Synoicihabitans sp.]|nr:TonB-dependent receptor [Candidatus Synoicihabitans sp.]
FNANGPDAENRRDGYSARAVATLQATDFLDLNLQAAKARYDEEIIDFNTFRPVAGQRPGQFVFNNRYEQRESGSETVSLKLEAAFKGRLLGADHSLLIGGLDQSNRSYTRTLVGPTRVWDPRADPIRRGRAEILSAFPNGLPARPSAGKATTRALYASDQAAFLEGRLRLVLGARYTKTENASGREQEETTPQFGVLFRPVPAIGLYANYSETFEPNYLLDGTGRQLDPISGTGGEVGFKIEAMEGRFTSTFAVFETERANIPRRDFPNEQLTGIVPLYILGGVERNRGFEADFTWSPSRNYQIVAAYSYSWEHQTIASTGDARQVGVDLPNVPDHILNVWNKYTFVDGPLKNVSIGGGAKFVTSQKLHPSWDVPVRGEGYVTFDAMIGYEHRFPGNRQLELQLNLINLTSERYYQGTYLTSDPLTAQFTVRLQF